MAAIINLRTLFKNHFNTKEISDDDLKKFSEDHLARIAANNPSNLFDTIIAAMGVAHTSYFGAISREDVAGAVQQALTKQVDSLMDTFKKTVERKEGAIRSAFGADAPEYQEFFPQGRTEYSTADKANVEMLMLRFATAATTYAAQLENGLSSVFTSLHTLYQSARTAQLAKKGQVGDLRDATAATRDVVEVQLTKNLHFIAYQFPGDVEKCMSYFDQSFLRDADADNNDVDGSLPDNPPA